MTDFTSVHPQLISLTHSRFAAAPIVTLRLSSGGCAAPRALIRDLSPLPIMLGRVLRATPRLIYTTRYPSQLQATLISAASQLAQQVLISAGALCSSALRNQAGGASSVPGVIRSRLKSLLRYNFPNIRCRMNMAEASCTPPPGCEDVAYSSITSDCNNSTTSQVACSVF